MNELVIDRVEFCVCACFCQLSRMHRAVYRARLFCHFCAHVQFVMLVVFIPICLVREFALLVVMLYFLDPVVQTPILFQAGQCLNHEVCKDSACFGR